MNFEVYIPHVYVKYGRVRKQNKRLRRKVCEKLIHKLSEHSGVVGVSVNKGYVRINCLSVYCKYTKISANIDSDAIEKIKNSGSLRVYMSVLKLNSLHIVVGDKLISVT